MQPDASNFVMLTLLLQHSSVSSFSQPDTSSLGSSFEPQFSVLSSVKYLIPVRSVMFVGEIDLFYIFDLVLGEVAVAVFVIFV